MRAEKGKGDISRQLDREKYPRPLFLRLLIATTNQDKLHEIAVLLEDLPFDVVTLAEWPDVPAAEETEATFAANARAKAIYYARQTGELTVAEDSGLEIDALDGAPGVESGRFGGAVTSYPDKFGLIYDALGKKGASDSPARFVCALALAKGETILFETRGTIEGKIATEPRGHGGFGYDPIFLYPPLGRTLAEVPDQKSAISHRAHAFRALRAYLLSSTNFQG